MRRAGRRPRFAEADPESGQVSILVLGMLVISLTLVLGVVGVTAVQLGRIALLDAADAAALDAADAVEQEDIYTGGVGSGVPLSDAGVQEAAAAHLVDRQRPDRIASWGLSAGTGTPDGRTAVVRLSGQVRVPLVSWVAGLVGQQVTVTVESRARSDLE